MIKKYELLPIYDSRQSFYKKAFVVEDDDLITLVSYGTNILTIVKDNERAEKHGKVVECEWLEDGNKSQTTSRHIKEFLVQNGLDYDLWKKCGYKAK